MGVWKRSAAVALALIRTTTPPSPWIQMIATRETLQLRNLSRHHLCAPLLLASLLRRHRAQRCRYPHAPLGRTTRVLCAPPPLLLRTIPTQLFRFARHSLPTIGSAALVTVTTLPMLRVPPTTFPIATPRDRSSVPPLPKADKRPPTPRRPITCTRSSTSTCRHS